MAQSPSPSIDDTLDDESSQSRDTHPPMRPPLLLVSSDTNAAAEQLRTFSAPLLHTYHSYGALGQQENTQPNDVDDDNSDAASYFSADDIDPATAVAYIRRRPTVGPDCLRYRLSGRESWLMPNEYASWRSQPMHISMPRQLMRAASRLSLPSMAVGKA